MEEFLKGKNILIISPESFDHIPVSKHHYAKALAELGNSVFFLNPPGKSNRITEVSDKLTIVDYHAIRGVNHMPGIFRDFFNSLMIGRIERLCNVRFDVAWSFDPSRFQNLKRFRHALVRIYHVVDVHNATLESEAGTTADVIFGTSDQILKPFALSGKLVTKINHGLAPHFHSYSPTTNVNNPLKVGYVGNLDSRVLDKETLLEIVRQNPNVDFIFIGPYHEASDIKSALAGHENCRFLGQIPSEGLPRYLADCDLFLMCYDGNQIAANSNPHKVLEYIATGKPAVINYTDEYKNNDLVIMARSNKELPTLFQKVITDIARFNTPELQARRIAFAHANSYSQHVRTIDRILTNFLQKSSV